ncbi:MAG: hypothetical protein M1608_03420 [Candidatus Omnitrophica bacterium]|nr:hypothetical protein [Candidatus Omnitrophota bacterium]
MVIFAVAGLMVLSCDTGRWLRAAPAKMVADRTAVFDMDGRRILQDENDLGIINGKLTARINCRDVAGIGGLWSPPYVSSNFVLDGRVNGEKVPAKKWTWRPFQVEREGALGNVAVSSTTTMVYGHRAAIVCFTFKNSGPTAVPLELFTLGWLDSVRDWGFARPLSRTETTLEAGGRQLSLRQGKLAVVVAIDSTDWSWEVSGNLGHAVALLPPRRSGSANVVIAIGSGDEAAASVAQILGDPAGSIASAKKEYARRVGEVFERLPSLESDNAQLVRWYNRSLVHFLMNRWDLPEFVLHPYYSTGSVNGGCLANYLWNFGEAWEILPLFDPASARTHIRQFLKVDLLKHFLFNPITGAAEGPWYMINQEKIIGLTYYYVLLTGDTAFLADTVDGKSVRDHMVIQAMFGDDVRKPIALIDYGPSNSHLELRRRYAYNHIMPDLNARRYANYLRAATLCDLAGKPAPFLRDRAELLKPLLKQRLWDAPARWFRFEDEKGKSEPRYTVQMFKPIGSGVLDKECEEGLLSHLNEAEFLSAYGLHSLSKRDPAYDQLDIDNGGGGICASFPPQIIERLYQAGHPRLAADIMGRLLWWGDAMPYWGDSIAANCKDYRRDTPLQCAFDGVSAAQCIIFGVFGARARSNGDIVIEPRQLPFARQLTLDGLKLRGQSINVHMDGDHYEVHSGDRTLRSTIGKSIIVSTKGRQLQPGK